MNQEISQKELFLSWQGDVIGPHTLSEVRTLLKLGKIHSLYKIQSEGEWILLRDHLADVDQQSREEKMRTAEQQADSGDKPFVSGMVRPAILVPDKDNLNGMGMSAPLHLVEEENDEVEEPKGISITTFVLSLLFFVPFLNGITWLLSLIFGHLYCAQTEHNKRSKYGTLAWLGLWITYVEISYFLLALAWLSIMEYPNMTLMFFVIHGQMLSTGLAALIGAGVIMLAVKLTSGRLIRFSVCFVSALLPSALGALGMLMVQTSVAPYDLGKAKGLALIGVVNVILFITQMFFWAVFIRLPDDSELGLGRSALASLIYTTIFFFVGLGYAALLIFLTGQHFY